MYPAHKENMYMYLVHNKFKDCFLEVLNIYRIGMSTTKYKVTWWNMGFTGDPWTLGLTQNIRLTDEVRKKDWKTFSRMEDIVLPGRGVIWS